MCGLVGYISAFNSGVFSADVDKFKQMLWIDTLRGDDATGVCFVKNDQSATVYKEAHEAQYFLLDKDLKKEFSEATKTTKALLGHNRKATVGGASDKNAHPFTYDDRYVFFHNGTLHNHKVFGDTDVDSEALGQHVTACEGDLEKLGEVFGKAQGAWALVWYDSVKHKIYLTRNTQRPLSIIKLKNGDIAYSSEAWIAIGPIQRNSGVVEETIPLKEGKLYTIDLIPFKPTITEEDIPVKKPISIPTKLPHGDVKTIGQISKKAAAALVKQYEQRGYLSFTVDDYHCPVLNGDPYEAYDYFVSGFNEHEKGVMVYGKLQDKYEYEMAQLVGARMFGYYEDAEYSNGVLKVWVKYVSEMESKLLC